MSIKIVSSVYVKSNLLTVMLRPSVTLLILLSAFSVSYWEYFKIPFCNCGLVLFLILAVSFCFCVFWSYFKPMQI